MTIKLDKDQSVFTARIKLLISVGAGVVIGLIAGILVDWKISPLVGWDSAALVYMTATWSKVLRFDPSLVEQHALREDPSRAIADTFLLAASLVSLAAVFVVLVGTGQAKGAATVLLPLLCIFSVVVSWFMIHSVYTLRYAELYYTKPKGGVDFGDTTPPVYSDFAYLAFTIGMTFQVSDSTLKNHRFRLTALKQALLSYLFGTIIIATTINLIAGLAK
jgi:uncharacterized membrane protein